MMASEKQQVLLGMLAESLSQQAVDLSGEGSAEYAFPLTCAREVFDSLERGGVHVLGGDLWMSRNDGFASAHEGWHVASDCTPSRRRHEWERLISRCPAESAYYVTFVW